MLLIDFVNVGYGDCVLVRETAGEKVVFSMLVDCGDKHIPIPQGSPRRSAASYLSGLGVGRLDLAVITHLHLDHVGGLEQLLTEVQVENLWTNHLPPASFWGKELAGGEPLSPGAQNLFVAYNLFSRCLLRLEQAGTQIHLVQRSLGRAPLGKGKLEATVVCKADALYARQDSIWQDAIQTGASNKALEDLDAWINDTSIRLRLSWNGKEVELPGDLGVEPWLAGTPDPCHILKLPHHGHRDCVNGELLERLTPEHAVICVSDDRRDDCPSGAIRSLLAKSGIPVQFTDRVAQAHAAVRFEIDEQGEISSPQPRVRQIPVPLP